MARRKRTPKRSPKRAARRLTVEQRQVQVLELRLQALPLREIARRLHVSHEQVRQDLQDSYRRHQVGEATLVAELQTVASDAPPSWWVGKDREELSRLAHEREDWGHGGRWARPSVPFRD